MDRDVKPGGMKRYLAGDIIFKEKEIHPYMYKVLKGSVALYVNYEEEHEDYAVFRFDDRIRYRYVRFADRLRRCR